MDESDEVSADDLIDSLKPRQNQSGMRVSEPTVTRPSGTPAASHATRPAGRHGLTRGALCAIIGGAAFLLGCCCNGMLMPIRLAGQLSSNDPAPTVTVTVTRQVTKEVQVPVIQEVGLSAKCLAAIANAQRILSSASEVASANGQQLDIIDEAYQAILLRDTQALNRATVKQRKLESKLSKPATPVLLAYQETMDGLKECQLG